MNTWVHVSDIYGVELKWNKETKVIILHYMHHYGCHYSLSNNRWECFMIDWEYRIHAYEKRKKKNTQTHKLIQQQYTKNSWKTNNFNKSINSMNRRIYMLDMPMQIAWQINMAEQLKTLLRLENNCASVPPNMRGLLKIHVHCESLIIHTHCVPPRTGGGFLKCMRIINAAECRFA